MASKCNGTGTGRAGMNSDIQAFAAFCIVCFLHLRFPLSLPGPYQNRKLSSLHHAGTEKLRGARTASASEREGGF